MRHPAPSRTRIAALIAAALLCAAASPALAIAVGAAQVRQVGVLTARQGDADGVVLAAERECPSGGCPGISEDAMLFMDMYHPEHRETAAPPGFTLVR
jgi:uncharacterized membrane protein